MKFFMSQVGFALLAFACLAIVLELLKRPPNVDGLIGGGVVALVGGLLRYYAKPKKQQSHEEERVNGPGSQT
jgi:hypothetical protein